MREETFSKSLRFPLTRRDTVFQEHLMNAESWPGQKPFKSYIEITVQFTVQILLHSFNWPQTSANQRRVNHNRAAPKFRAQSLWDILILQTTGQALVDAAFMCLTHCGWSQVWRAVHAFTWYFQLRTIFKVSKNKKCNCNWDKYSLGVLSTRRCQLTTPSTPSQA